MTKTNFKRMELPGRLSCRIFGEFGYDKPTLFVLPGGPGIHSGYLDETAAELSVACGIIVVLFDLPGHRGTETEGSTSYEGPDFLSTCELLSSGIRSLTKHGRAMLLGHSFGALLALELICSNKAFFTSAFLISTPASEESSDRYEVLKRDLGIGAVEINDEADFKAYWRQILPLYFNRAPFTSELDLLAQETFWFQGSAILKRVIWPLERSSGDVGDLSVLFLQGDADLRVPSENSKRLKRVFPGATFVELPGVGHFPMLEAKIDFLAAIRKFIDSSGGLS